MFVVVSLRGVDVLGRDGRVEFHFCDFQGHTLFLLKTLLVVGNLTN